MEKTNVWNVCDITNPQERTITLLVLNNEGHEENLMWLKHFCPKATQTVCVDGGLNFFENFNKMETEKDITKNNNINCKIQIPDYITGDFDSVDLKLLDMYKLKGSLVVETPDQDETDFTKALKLTKTHFKKSSLVCAVAKMDSCRVDHFFGIVHSLFKGANYGCSPIVVFSGTSLYWLLSEGYHEIQIPMDIVQSDNSWCGLIPLIPTIVTSTGLKWNLENCELSFGKLVSSSNTYCENSQGVVTIKTSAPLLWTMGIKSPC